MKVAIIDYGSGNLRSVAKAFERAAIEIGISARVEVTDRAEAVVDADRVVLPGVGAFADCRRGLAAIAGLESALREAVIVRARSGDELHPERRLGIRHARGEEPVGRVSGIRTAAGGRARVE